MLSSALVAVLRVGAVVLTAGGLGTGVYFLAPAGEGEDAASRLQAPEATAVVDAPGLQPPSRPTLTFPPAPVTPRPIDTANWRTYSSPLGFTIKYPPGWVVEEQAPPSLSPVEEQMVRGGAIPPPPSAGAIILNERMRDLKETGEIIIDGGTVIMPQGSSVAWFEISPMPFPPQFDANVLFEFCQPDDPPLPEPGRIREATEAAFAGRPAVRCFTEGLDRSGEHWVTTDAYWIAPASGGMLSIVAYAFDGDERTFGLIRAMLASVSVRGVQ
ncbi:MAG: hypothetical protein IIB21_04000 [Chloroflexi bacterium]|nr:hypothetical protein [Chloroflexota bacterium]